MQVNRGASVYMLKFRPSTKGVKSVYLTVRGFGSTMFDLPADMVTAADFDLDGRLECVVGRVGSRRVMVFSRWSGNDEWQATIGLNGQPVALTPGDCDGDRVPEIAAAPADAQLTLLARAP